MQEIKPVRMETQDKQWKRLPKMGQGCAFLHPSPRHIWYSLVKSTLLGTQSWESSLEIRELDSFFYEEIGVLQLFKPSKRRTEKNSHPSYRPVVIFPTQEIQTTSTTSLHHPPLQGCKLHRERSWTPCSTAADVPLGINH